MIKNHTIILTELKLELLRKTLMEYSQGHFAQLLLFMQLFTLAVLECGDIKNHLLP